jgi:hypothetical protein
MRRILLMTCVAAVLIVCAVSTTATSRQTDRDAPIQLHKELLETAFLRGESSLLAATALPNLIVVPPGGVVERRDQVIRGLPNVGAESVRLLPTTVRRPWWWRASVSRARPARTRGPGRSRMMNVFVKDQGQWRLLARSIQHLRHGPILAGRSMLVNLTNPPGETWADGVFVLPA